MAEPYKFSGQSGLFFKELYSSQDAGSALEAAMAQVCPCLFFFEGKCILGADAYGSSAEAITPGEDLKTTCVGAKVRCSYYTGKFEYLVKDYVKDGKPVRAEQFVEIFNEYFKHSCPYNATNSFAKEDGLSSFSGLYRDSFNNMLLLPKRVKVGDDNSISALPYHPPSTEYGDYISFITNEYFKLLFPRVIYPTDIRNTIYESDKVSVLLDVPGGGYTYVIYLSELGMSDLYIDVINGFFETGDVVLRDSRGNIISESHNINGFFEELVKKLNEKRNLNLVVEGEKIGFGISLATLSSVYDLSKCIIIYSENKLFFSEEIFDVTNAFIGMFSVDKVRGVAINMVYKEVNFASNCIYDLATDYTLDVSYADDHSLSSPTISGATKGQDISFGVTASIESKNTTYDEYEEEEEAITLTALHLPWYNSTETDKKYLWALKSKEKKYSINIINNVAEHTFDDGKITLFKNVIILHINDSTFPFYIKDCTYNSYPYTPKYQTYHPMLEYDVNCDMSFSYSIVSPGGISIVESATIEYPNTNRAQLHDPEDTISTTTVKLLKSLPCGLVMLVPNVTNYIRDFDSEVRLEFTLVRGDKIEYFPEKSECKDKDLLIPDKCSSVEQFSLTDLAREKTYSTLTKVVPEPEEPEEPEEDRDVMSISNLVEGTQNNEYYVEMFCDLEIDEGTGATYKQKDIIEASYFYSSYSSFNFLLEILSKETNQEEEIHPDYENTDIQKFLRGERPLLSVDCLGMTQEQSNNQEGYDFKYLYEKTVRSFINNRFYQVFPKDVLSGKGAARTGGTFYSIDSESIFNMPGVYTADQCSWILPFSKSVSDFYILKKLEDDKILPDPDAPEPPPKINHNLTHISDMYRFYGFPICGFTKKGYNLCDAFDKLVFDKFLFSFDKVFYFYIFGISKFVQDYLFLVKYKNSIIPVLKRIPVIVSQVGLPDPEIKYKWKSKCSIYTHLYDTGLNPFKKTIDSNNLDFFMNPFYVIVHKDYRDDKYTGTRTSTNDYGFLFSTNWWVKYKQKLDNFGYVRGSGNTYNAFIDVYRTLAGTGGNAPKERDIISGFARGKDILYIELEPIDYVYCSYCGDHDFSIGDTTPYLYDRAADVAITSGYTDPVSSATANTLAYTADYDKSGVGIRRARPCSRFVGPMWFPFRACEVARYNEFSDYPGVRKLIDAQSNIYKAFIRGFSCTDLIFKPYNTADIEYSNFKHLFIDDCFGSINPYRYVSSFYSSDVLSYYNETGTSTEEVAPKYLASNASVPWRSIPVLFKKENDLFYTVIAKTHKYIVETTQTGIADCASSFEKYIYIDASDYMEFNDVGGTSIKITKSDQPEPGLSRSILYNCLLDIPPMLPYNYNKNKYVCGYERMRGGDANFIYQCLYPYHHVYTHRTGCKCLFDYENKGEESYGSVDNTLIPHVLPTKPDAGMIIEGSVFYPAMFARFSCAGYLLEHIPWHIPWDFMIVKDWLAATNIPYIRIYRCVSLPLTKLEGVSDSFWSNFDTLDCKTDGPALMRACLNHYTFLCEGRTKDADGNFTIECKKEYDFKGLLFADTGSNCTENYEVPKCETTSDFVVDTFTHSETNLTSRSLYYHFASDWAAAHDYIFLGATMENKPVFYGDGALRVFKTYDNLKTKFTIFDSGSETNSVDMPPVFGGLGRFFKMCYFSINYGKIPFSTISGINTLQRHDELESVDDNYVYKLSGHNNTDVAFDNNFEYGYLPEKGLVYVSEDVGMFTSMYNFTTQDTIAISTRDYVRFEDVVSYIQRDTEEESYFKYKGIDTGSNIIIKSFGAGEDIESGPAVAIIYDKKILQEDKYSYYSRYGLNILISEPVFGDTKIIDPFPFGDEIVVECCELVYDDGYLRDDMIELTLKSFNWETVIEIKVKEGGLSVFPWLFYIESEEEVINENGDKETKTVEIQYAYLCYDDSYKIGHLFERDENDDMLLSERDVIKKGDIKYKVNRGFYLDFRDMFLPYNTYETGCLLQELNSSTFTLAGVMSGDCFCDPGDIQTACYIILPDDCFIINLKGSFFSSSRYTEPTIIGYLCLETSEEFYAIGNLIAYPEFDSAGNNIKVNGKYHYNYGFGVYSNYNKVKYGGRRYKLVFNSVVFFCEGYSDQHVTVKYGRFNGGIICDVKFNKISSLKVLTYSKDLKPVLDGCDVEGINLYYENLNDKITDGDITKGVFYVMPLGFIYKLKGGVSEDSEVSFKNGYGSEFFDEERQFIYTYEEQVLLNRIGLSVERDVFNMINYPSCYTRFCFKSKIYETIGEDWKEFEASLIPDLYGFFGYVPVYQWVAPGHKLDLYPDSLYAGYAPAPSFEYQIAKLFANTDCLDILYKNDLDILAKKLEDTPEQYNYVKLLESCGTKDTLKMSGFSDKIITPHHIPFITHVAHGMFGYKDITNVSGWIERPSAPTVYGYYDKNGERIEQE